MPSERYTAERILALMHENWPESCTPASELMVRLHRLRALLYDTFCRTIVPYGLNVAEFDVLTTLRSVSPPYQLTPTELYDAVLLSSGGMTKVLKSLEARQLITRVANEFDGRSTLVRLSSQGKTLAEASMQAALQADSAFIASGLTPSELTRLTALIRKLLLAVEPDSPQLPPPQ
jgi:DNA-binding MarR family transcriptional regulator